MNSKQNQSAFSCIHPNLQQFFFPNSYFQKDLTLQLSPTIVDDYISHLNVRYPEGTGDVGIVKIKIWGQHERTSNLGSPKQL